MLPIEKQTNTQLKIICKYAEICTLETENIAGNLLFAISLPLIENNDYSLYELIPFPFANNYPSLNLFYLHPPQRYLILSTRTGRYTLLDELTQCTTISMVYYLCQLHDLSSTKRGPCAVASGSFMKTNLSVNYPTWRLKQKFGDTTNSIPGFSHSTALGESPSTATRPPCNNNYQTPASCDYQPHARLQQTNMPSIHITIFCLLILLSTSYLASTSRTQLS